MRAPISLFVLLLSVACSEATPSGAPAAAADDALSSAALVVNGRAISQSEVKLAMRARGPGRPLIPREEAVETLVRLELQAQAAEALGLHREPSFSAEMEQLQAKLTDARRSRLAKGYRLRTLSDLPEASDAEVLAYVEAKRERIGTEHRVSRLVTKSRGEAEAALVALEKGEAFDELAKKVSEESVELGVLGFDTLPEEWWGPLSKVSAGETTGVVETGERFAILRLVERRAAAAPTDEALKRRVSAVLRAKAFEAALAADVVQRREAALIEHRAPPAEAPHAKAE